MESEGRETPAAFGQIRTQVPLWPGICLNKDKEVQLRKVCPALPAHAPLCLPIPMPKGELFHMVVLVQAQGMQLFHSLKA